MKRKIIIIICLMLVITVELAIANTYQATTPNLEYENEVGVMEDEKINFVELYFPNLTVAEDCPLGREVFALSFIVDQYQCGYQTYGGKNLVAEVIKGPYNHNRFVGMDYNYFVGPDGWTNYNVTLVVRNGQCVDYVIEKLPMKPIIWNPMPAISIGELK